MVKTSATQQTALSSCYNWNVGIYKQKIFKAFHYKTKQTRNESEGQVILLAADNMNSLTGLQKKTRQHWNSRDHVTQSTDVEAVWE